MIELTPIVNKYYSCFDASVVTIAKSFKYDYYMLFCLRFFFNYLSNFSNTFGENICKINPFGSNNMIYDFHGIKINELTNSSNNEALRGIIALLSDNIPVLVYSDVFYNPWNMYYNKVHISHVIILYKFYDNKFGVLDPYFTDRNLILNRDSLYLSHNTLQYITFDPVPEPNFVKECEVLLETVTNYVKNICFKEVSALFADSIIHMDIEKELKHSVIAHDIRLLRQLRNLENNRLAYHEMIQKFKEKWLLNFTHIEDELINLTKLWQSLRLLLSKCLMGRSLRGKEDAIKNIVFNIFEKEEKVANDLQAFYSIR